MGGGGMLTVSICGGLDAHIQILTCEACGFTSITTIGKICPTCGVQFVHAKLLLDGCLIDTQNS